MTAQRVVFHQDVRCSASIFPLGKANGALREVWNGHDLSVIAASAPRPPHLAGVAALSKLRGDTYEADRVFKRDARYVFDQLTLDPLLQLYFWSS